MFSKNDYSVNKNFPKTQRLEYKLQNFLRFNKNDYLFTNSDISENPDQKFRLLSLMMFVIDVLIFF